MRVLFRFKIKLSINPHKAVSLRNHCRTECPAKLSEVMPDNARKIYHRVSLRQSFFKKAMWYTYPTTEKFSEITYSSPTAQIQNTVKSYFQLAKLLSIGCVAARSR